MTEKETVAALRCISTAGGENACEHCPYWKEIERLTARCARYAEEIAVAQERTRWVPVEERLPEVSNSWGVSDIVLCIISDPSGYPPPNPGLCVYLEDGRWTCHGMIVRVTYWMPLPAPPEEER